VLAIDIANLQTRVAIDPRRLRRAVRLVLTDAGIGSGEISVAIVDDQRIHELNRNFLQHDYATDVLSFLLETAGPTGPITGEIVASGDYAAREAPRYGWSAADELLLYVIHGSLHLAGYDDLTKRQAAEMRTAETAYLARLGVTRQQPEARPQRQGRPQQEAPSTVRKAVKRAAKPNQRTATARGKSSSTRAKSRTRVRT
jgi:probable rRNA maturation factor